MNKVKPLVALAIMLLLSSESAFACNVCMGGAESKVGGQVNAAIFLLLGVLFVVGSFFFGFLLYLVRCERRPVPPHHDFDNLVEPDALS